MKEDQKKLKAIDYKQLYEFFENFMRNNNMVNDNIIASLEEFIQDIAHAYKYPFERYIGNN